VPGGTPRLTSSVSNSNNDREVQDLRLALKKQTDASADVLERLRHTKNQFEQERALNEELRVAQSQHEKQKQALSLKIIDLEARLLGPSGPDSKYLQDKVAALERQIEEQSRRYVEETREVRTNDRSVKDLYSQLSQKEKLIARLQDDASRLESKMQRLLESMEALQTSETNHRLSARRAEREARDVKERSLRHEKELEEWKNRFESLTSRGESFV
jgi:myosin protein heavy chain